jgi:hypothetical protein
MKRDFARHLEYIDQNPVRAGLVKKPEEYPYSSAHAGFVLDALPFVTRAKAHAS